MIKEFSTFLNENVDDEIDTSDGVVVDLNKISHKFRNIEEKYYEEELRKIFLNKVVQFKAYKYSDGAGQHLGGEEIIITDEIVALDIVSHRVQVTIPNGKKYYFFYTQNSICIKDSSLKKIKPRIRWYKKGKLLNDDEWAT